MISASDLSTLLPTSKAAALLDVRERAAYERGHIYRATSLPRRLLEARLPRLVTAPKTTIVVYDDGQVHGQVATLAAKTITAMGYTDVHVSPHALLPGIARP
jgi:rhodanese-related sulfurtransferase